MKNLLTLLLLIPFIGFAQNPNPSTTLDSYIAGEMSAEKIPGMSTLIVKDGEIVWRESYGLADVANNIPVTDTTVFLMASVSKVFTGTALMQLYENGQINLDEDINNYLPFAVDIPNHVSDSITFRMLMTHTSSIKDNGPVMDTYYSIGDPTITLADCIERYFSTSGSDYNATANFHTNAPGTSFDYSNMGTALAGYLVEVISGISFSEYCNNNIFDEICMENTSWYLADFDTSNVARPHKWQGGQYVPYNHYGFADYPNGQLRSNITDMANFAIAYLQNGAFNSQQILNSASVNEMLTLQIPNIENTQGLNWYTEEIYLSGGGTVNLWGHNGGEDGVSTDMYINPDNNIGIVVLSNGEGDNLYVVDELYDYALSLTTSGIGNPSCNTTTAIEEVNSNKTLLKIVDVLGRETIPTKNTPLFYIYDDGTVEKKIVIE
ncbi:MAG: beta-lactamase family protein [Flavobacteriales bacterium]|nr:beta-lactamase family protein [Flavobacteriales bacterium]